MINCAEKCKHQTDGYCNLSGNMTVTNLNGKCPHFEKESIDKVNCFVYGSDINKVNSFGNSGTH